MKRSLVIVLIFIAGVVTVPAFAARNFDGASANAIARANNENIFHKIGDWFATAGRSPREQQAILAERKMNRSVVRTREDVRRAQRKWK